MFYEVLEMEHWLKWVKHLALFFTKGNRGHYS